MAGLLKPYVAYELVKQLREETGLPVHMHCHATSGMSETSYMKAHRGRRRDHRHGHLLDVRRGLRNRPPNRWWPCSVGTEYDTGLDLKKLQEISDYFEEVRVKYADFESAHTGVDTDALIYQIPGGMISNLASQLKEAKQEHKIQEIYEEVPRVRADLGYPPLVTPTSQIVGTQATLNVIAGERYKMVHERNEEPGARPVRPDAGGDRPGHTPEDHR